MLNDDMKFGFGDENDLYIINNNNNNNSFRNYNINYDTMSQKEIEKKEIIRNLYKTQRTNINYKFNEYLLNKYCKFNSLINFWSLFSTLDGIVDLSDPDTSMPNSLHALQTAEAIRSDGKPDWFVLCGLIHDLGKCIYLNGKDTDGTSKSTQWAIVGDTFITGAIIPSDIVLPEYNELNEDHQNKLSLYEDKCGIDNCMISFGHDEYLYKLIMANPHSLPEEALYIIRYHSLYVAHSGNGYDYLFSDKDQKMIPVVREFNKYDLYTKDDSNKIKWTPSLKEYYTKLIKKYLSADLMIRC
jgi:inositol oxygenase